MHDVGHCASVLRLLQRGLGPLLRDGVRGPPETTRSEKSLILIEAEAGDSGLSCRSHFYPRLSGDLCVPLTLRGGELSSRASARASVCFRDASRWRKIPAFAYSALFAAGGGRSIAARGRVVRGRSDFFFFFSPKCCGDM